MGMLDLQSASCPHSVGARDASRAARSSRPRTREVRDDADRSRGQEHARDEVRRAGQASVEEEVDEQPREAHERQEVVPRPVSARARHEADGHGAQEREDARPAGRAAVARSLGPTRKDSTTAVDQRQRRRQFPRVSSASHLDPVGSSPGRREQPKRDRRLLEHLGRPTLETVSRRSLLRTDTSCTTAPDGQNRNADQLRAAPAPPPGNGERNDHRRAGRRAESAR